MSDPDSDHDLVPGRGRSLLELLGLSGLTIAQPILSTFGDSPDFFVFRDASRLDIVVFALVVATAPGLVAWALSLLVGLVSDRGRGLVHAAALVGFVAVGVLQVTASQGVSSWIGVPLALGAGLALVAARFRYAGLRSWLGWLAPAPLAFVALFLFASPVSALVTDDAVDPARLGAFGSGDPPPVVVLVFDEWPLSSIVRTDGTIDRQVAPNVARLAERSTWYRNATTVSNMTNFAVPAILTGNEPEPGDRGDARNQPENLFTLLGGTYQLSAQESLTRMCPSSLCGDPARTASVGERADRLGGLVEEAASVFGDRLDPGEDDELLTDGFVEPDGAVEAARADDETFDLDELLEPRPERLDTFLEEIDADEPPTVHYVHALAPHTPHRHTPDGVRYEPDGSIRLISNADGSEDSDLRADVAWAAELDRQRLLLEVNYADRLVGDVIDRLEEVGLYDEALVVLTSDHGLAFEPGASARGIGDRAVEREIEADLLWVPLFVKAPGQSVGEMSDVDARTIDVVPTIAGHLDIEMPWDVDGVDLEGPGVDDRGPKTFVRIQGSSFALFEVEDPVAVRAEPDEVFAQGTDAHLDGTGDDRWWDVGPRRDLVKARIGDLQVAVEDAARVELDRAGDYEDIDVSSGEAPLLVTGRIRQDGEPRPDGPLLAILVDDVVAAVVPTFPDDNGPGRFAAVVDPELFAEPGRRVRIADVIDEPDGATTLRLVPEVGD